MNKVQRRKLSLIRRGFGRSQFGCPSCLRDKPGDQLLNPAVREERAHTAAFLRALRAGGEVVVDPWRELTFGTDAALRYAAKERCHTVGRGGKEGVICGIGRDLALDRAMAIVGIR